MKILATVIVLTLCLLAGSAYAADSQYNWSGIYGGASIGYVHASQDWKLGRDGFWGPKGTEQDFAVDQFDVGGFVGAQYQWKWLVLGAEGGIFKGPNDVQSKPSGYFPYSDTDQWRTDMHSIAKATAKVGYAYDRFLFYAKGGYAGAMVDTEVRYPITSPVLSHVAKTSQWQSGWTVGGGIEYALTNHIIIGAEYSYIDLGSQVHKTIDSGGAIFDAKVDAAVHQVLFRVSYKFDVF